MAETTIDTELAEEFSGSYTSESEAPRVGRGSSLTAPGQALGRRKEAVARVRLIPGSGEWKINGRTLDDYFPNKLHQQLVRSPFALLDLEGRFDVVAASTAGRLRPGRRTPPGHRARPQRHRSRLESSRTQEGRFPDPRRPRRRTQEGRSEEGPQGLPVLQALTPPSFRYGPRRAGPVRVRGQRRRLRSAGVHAGRTRGRPWDAWSADRRRCHTGRTPTGEE